MAAAVPTTTTNLGTMPPMNMSGLCSLAIFGSAEVNANFSPLVTTVRLWRDQIATVADQGTTERTCLPGEYWTAVIASENPVFSPATACPDGYAPACTSVAPGAALPAAVDVQVWPPLVSGDVAVGCCPSGYACDGPVSRGYGCISTVEGGHTTAVPDPYQGGRIITISANASTIIVVSAIRVVYVPERKASSRAPSPTRSPTSTPALPKPKRGLSRGEQAAIGVCAALVVVGILIALLLLYRKRRLQRRSNQRGPEDATDEDHRPELEGSGGKHEAPDETAGEAGGKSASVSPVELPGSDKESCARHEIAELPAGDTDVAPSVAHRQSPTIRRKPIGEPVLVRGEATTVVASIDLMRKQGSNT